MQAAPSPTATWARHALPRPFPRPRASVASTPRHATPFAEIAKIPLLSVAALRPARGGTGGVDPRLAANAPVETAVCGRSPRWITRSEELEVGAVPGGGRPS